MRGPKPTPTAIKAAKGNPGKRALPKDEPKPEALTTDAAPPSTLSAAGRLEWQRLAPKLSKACVLSELDADALELMCETWADLRRAQRAAKGKPQLVKVHGQIVQNPALALVRGLRAEIRAMQADFGMTPATRTRVTKVAPPKASNRFSVLNGGKGRAS